MREVYLYKKLGKKTVKCQNCAHYCVISSDKRGICGVRENQDGVLYALNYGKIIARGADPIEKKPFFHFFPGTKSYSIASEGCNFRCGNCQNWRISQVARDKDCLEISGEKITPNKIVLAALRAKCPSVAYTYTEPTIFLEFALDAMKIAKSKGLKNIFVSNGFMSKEAAKMIIPYLDADNIDIKSFSDKFYLENCGGRLQPVLDCAKLMKKSGVWVEITTLAIPVLNDSEETFKGIARFIFNELGSETPWHISRFSGAFAWKQRHLPDTPIETLEAAYKIGKRAGLKYVYIGNVPGLHSENSICPKCKAMVISRFGYSIKRHDKNGKCPKCYNDMDIMEK